MMFSVQEVYLNGTFECGSTLTQKYVDNAREIAQQRIALAGYSIDCSSFFISFNHSIIHSFIYHTGYRLAALLRSVAPRHYVAKTPSFCAAMTADDASVLLHVRLTESTLVAVVVGATLLLLVLVVVAFLLGIRRGVRRATGPRMQFERIN